MDERRSHKTLEKQLRSTVVLFNLKKPDLPGSNTFKEVHWTRDEPTNKVSISALNFQQNRNYRVKKIEHNKFKGRLNQFLN